MHVDLATRSIRLLTLGLCTWLTVLPIAHAQTSATDKALAESLFDRGLELMRSGKDEEACQNLERSQAIEPGVGTMLYLAECYEKLGRTASAWATYREAASAAQAQGQLERAKKGASRAEYLTPSLSKLTFVLASGAVVPGLTITRNGEPVPNAAFGAALPVDPGEQRIMAAAPGHQPWNITVLLPPNGARMVVDVPALQPLAAAEEPQAAPPPAVAEPSSAPSPTAAELQLSAARDKPAHATFHKPLAYVLGGVGIVALGVGGYFGGRAISENNKADEACPNERCTGQIGIDHDKAAHQAATAANLLVAGGLALVAAGIVVFVTRPREDNVQVALTGGPTSAQLQLRGAF
jgi:tetratricopeptide (TPR) repeat protein